MKFYTAKVKFSAPRMKFQHRTAKLYAAADKISASAKCTNAGKFHAPAPLSCRKRTSAGKISRKTQDQKTARSRR